MGHCDNEYVKLNDKNRSGGAVMHDQACTVTSCARICESSNETTISRSDRNDSWNTKILLSFLKYKLLCHRFIGSKLN